MQVSEKVGAIRVGGVFLASQKVALGPLMELNHYVPA